MKFNIKTILTTTVIGLSAIGLSQSALAYHKCKGKSHCKKKQCKIRQYKDGGYSKTPYWYAGASIGASEAHDRKSNGATNSYVNQFGPAWAVRAGYQHDAMWGGEWGFFNYADSRETAAGSGVSRTEHWGTYVAATGRYPIWRDVDAVGKLGPAYSYARKNGYTTGGATGHSVSVFYSLGVAYNISKKFDAVANWERIMGNDATGTTDMFGFGLNMRVA